MDNKLFYKVLWIDDQEFDAILNEAEDYQLEIERYPTWEAAKPVLAKNLDGYSAIILDCYCKLEEKDNRTEDDHFLIEVFTQLHRMLGDKRYLPWYIYSGGDTKGDSNFTFLMELNKRKEREAWDKDWKKGYYSKSAFDDKTQKFDYQIMLENIQKEAKKTTENKVRAKYPDAFKAASFFGGTIEHDLLNFLVKDYENDLNDTYLYYNCVREIMELVFEDGKKRRIFPPLGDTNGFGCLLDKGIVMGKKGKGWKIENYETFIPKALGHAISFILDFANQGSHNMTKDKVSYYVKETNNIRLFRAMLNIEMDLLVWYHELCKKVDDVNNTDYMPEKLFVRVKEGEPLTNLVVHEKYQNGWHYYVEKDDLTIELNVKHETNEPQLNKPQLKEGLLVDVYKYHAGNNFSDIASHFSRNDEYIVLQRSITVYDQDNNVLMQDAASGNRNAKVDGAGVKYFGLPQEVKVTPCAGYYIDSIVSESLLSNDLIQINNKYSIATIEIKELIEDLKFTVTILPWPKLKIKPNHEEGGSVTNDVSSTPGSIVSIFAIPSEGYEFVEWQGCEVMDKQSQQTTLIMPTYDVSLVAIFKKKDE
jgi:hypothetical protein